MVERLGTLVTEEAFIPNISIGEVAAIVSEPDHPRTYKGPTRPGESRLVEGILLRRIDLSEEERKLGLVQLGEVVREHRRASGFSQAEIAGGMGISTSNISRIETASYTSYGEKNGGPTPGRIIEIANFLKLDPAELLALAGYEVVEVPSDQ